MSEPASFTDPGYGGYDLTDVDLPRHCANCRGFLPLANKWTVEDCGDEVNAYFECVKCGRMNVRLLTVRR